MSTSNTSSSLTIHKDAGGHSQHGRKACNKCRIRKVKCDGGRPYCKECASGRAAWECFYPESARRGRPKRASVPRPKTPPSEQDGSEFNAVIADADLTTPIDAIDDFLLPVGIPHKSKASEHMLYNAYGMDEFCQALWPNPYTYGDSGIDVSLDEMDMVTTAVTDTVPPVWRMPPMEPNMSIIPAPDSEHAHMGIIDNIPTSLVHEILQTYFEACQCGMRMFHRTLDVTQFVEQDSREAIALKCAMLIHAIPHCPEFTDRATANLELAAPDGPEITAARHHQDHFYQLACRAIGECDLNRDLSWASMRLLQAVVLLGLFELQNADFARAWLTVSRADWLTRSMQLRRLDSTGSPLIADVGLLEEGRRALWATIRLNCLMMTSGKTVDSMEEITTYLPQPSPTGMLQSPGVTMQSIICNAASRPLSIEEALWASHLLTRPIAMHVKENKLSSSSPERQPYNYWTNQHHLERTLLYLQNFVKTSPWPATDLQTMLDLVVKTWHVVLHTAKLNKMNLSCGDVHNDDQIRTTQSTLLQRTLKLANYLRASVFPGDVASCVTVSWATFVTLQSLLRCKRQQFVSPDDVGLMNDVEHPMAGTFAQILDSYDALESLLISKSDYSPIVKFYQAQLEIENRSGDVDLANYTVGFGEFTTP